MSHDPSTRRLPDLRSLSFLTLALWLATSALFASNRPTKQSSESLVQRRAPEVPPAYSRPQIGQKVARSAGAAAERDWTLLYYLDADCNLEAPMLDDVDEMELVGASDAVNILALIDRTPEYETRDGNWSNSRLLYVTHDRDHERLGSVVLSNLKELDTANPQTLVDFVAFGIQNFPAKHYALVLGDHGGTWMGMLNDESSNPAGMKLASLLQGLEALRVAGAPKLDLVVFDMCLMAQVEVMDAIAPYALYGVASEELEPGTGYPNHRVLHQLARNPKMSAREFAQTLVREWGASYAEVGEATVTSSATDLSKMGDLARAVDALAAALMQAPESVRAAAARARAATHFFGGAEAGGELASFDVGEFAGLLARQPEATPIRPQLDAVVAAVDAAVIEHAEGAAHVGATGLAIYFPADRSVHADYASLPLARTQWDEFLAGGVAGGGGGAMGVAITSPDPGGSHPIGSGLQVTAKVSGSPVSVRAAIGYRDRDGGTTLVSEQEIPSPQAQSLENGTVVSAWKDGDTFVYTLKPQVRAIGDGRSARLAPMTPLSPGSPYAAAVASYNSLMGDYEVAAVFDTKAGVLETLFCLNEKGAATPQAVHPVKGERLVFYQTVSAGPGKEVRYRPVPALVSGGEPRASQRPGRSGNPARGGSGLRLVESGLPAGSYVLTLTTYDAAGTPGGHAELAVAATGEGVAPGVDHPDYGMPAVAAEDLEWVDLTLLIPPSEYGQFEATWDDYDFMAAAESDDLSSGDLAFLEGVALTAEDLEFDVENWSTEFLAEEMLDDGDLDDDGTPDSDGDDSNGVPDTDEDDADGDGVPDEEDDDGDDDGIPDEEDDDGGDEGDADDNGLPDEEDPGDDGGDDGGDDDDDPDDDDPGDDDPGDDDPGDDDPGDDDPGDDDPRAKSSSLG